MHRVHHSIRKAETNSNYGFSLSIWDRLFKSYTAQPAKGHDDMIIGLEEYQTSGPASLLWSMTLPFKTVKKLEKWL
jgi:sterol desaturase/sphingolipid hydroxylase (fatty acid hydroxylase superfamily)